MGVGYIKKFSKKSKFINIFVFVMVCLALWCFIEKIVPKMEMFCKQININDVIETKERLKNGVVFEESFYMPFSYFNGVSIDLEKGEGNNIGKINVEVINPQNDIIYYWCVREDLLDDNGFQLFKTNEIIPVDVSEQYKIKIYSNSNDKLCSYIGLSNTKVCQQGNTKKNDTVINQDIAFKVSGRNDGADTRGYFYIICLFFVVILFGGVYWIFSNKTNELMCNIKKWDIVLIIFIAVGCSILFSQYKDIEITIKHSEDLISIIKNGKFFNFYDIVLEKALNGGYGEASVLNAANYNIFLYLALSIIIFPFVFIRKVFHIQYSILFISIYVQFILIILDFIAAYLLASICEQFGYNKRYAHLVGYLFLSSSITIFATVGFAQLDIIYIIIMLIAIKYYANGKYYRFAFVMSISIMLKLFPILLFLPLVLLKNKKVWKILSYYMVGLSSTVLFSLFFGNKYGYLTTKTKMEQFYDFTGRMFRCNIDTSMSKISILILIFVILCVWAYNKNIESKVELYKNVIFCGLVCYASIAILILWHPQWLIILSIFISMAIPHFKNIKTSLLCDLGIQSMYLLICNFYFANNVDNTMINNGILPILTGHFYSGITISDIISQISNAQLLLFTAFAGLLIAFIGLYWEENRNHNEMLQEIACERFMVWSRVFLIYGYCFLLLVFYFYLG